MKNLNTEEAGEKLGIKQNSVQHAIREGKIQATKNSRGHYRIQESEIERIQDAKYELDSSEYYTKRDVEKLGFSSEIFYNGTLETIKIDGITVAKREEIRRYIRTKINGKEEEEITWSQDIIVGLRYGIDIDVACDICKICGNYLYRSKVRTNIICKNGKWEYLGAFGHRVDQLASKCIKNKDVITIETIGIESQAKELNDFLARVILDIKA